MTSTLKKVSALLFLINIGAVVSQTQNVQWVDNLSDLLTNTGLREDLAKGTLLGTLTITGVPTDIIHVSYSTDSLYFSVTELTGEVRLNAELSYRNMPTFVATFFAKDLSQGFSVQKMITVNVRGVNHPPKFDVPVYQVSVKDNVQTGTEIYRWIYVTDIDTGPNGTVTLSCDPPANDAEAKLACETFSIMKQNVTGKDDSYFGSVSTVLGLNYQDRPKYTLPLLVKDDGNPSLSSTATLIINIESQFDNRPVFLNTPIILNINEFAPSTTDLVSVQAKTGNPNRTMPLRLKISEDTKGWFYLDSTVVLTSSDTKIYSAKIQTNGKINRAELPSNQYTFKIAAVELNGDVETPVMSETTVVVIVNDTNSYNPTFSSPTYTVNLMEGLGVGAVIPGLSMIVIDLDQGDNAYFSINVTNVIPSPVDNIFLAQPAFAQGSASVYLTANKPEYLQYADPNKRKYTVKITARETRTAEQNSGSTTVTINILSRNNNPPVFTRPEYLASLVDNRDPGIIITDQIKAIDPDSNEAGRVSYRILSGNDNTYFAINPDTAFITLAKKLKYNDTGPYIALTILAQDGTGLNATTTLRIQIINSQQGGPTFNPEFITTIVPENSVDLIPPIEFVASPLQRDRTVSYQIVGGNKDIFTLTQIPTSPGAPDRAKVTMKRGVDYNETPGKSGVFQVTVQATTSAPGPLSSNLTINVYVTDSNNHPPVFSPTFYKTEITEITPPETSLVTVNATDDDAPNTNNAKIHYIIDSGSRDNFVVDYTTGLIRIASRPDLSIDHFGDQYNITVLAVDEGGPPNTATATVYVTVKDSVYRSPSFQSQIYAFYVNESSPVKTYVGSTPARSPDRRAILFYSIQSDSIFAKNRDGQPVTTSNGNFNYNTSFAIDSKNGSITVNGPLNYSIYFVRIDFQVKAEVTNLEINSTVPPALANVTIYILQMLQSSDTVTFLEPSNRFAYISIYNTLPVGTVLYTLTAFHVGTSRQISRYTYTTQVQETQGYINVANNTGVITLAQDLSKAGLKLPINLTYEVTAMADPPSTATEKATVVINVRDVNADVPIFKQARYNFTIFNNVSRGYFVGNIDATLPGSSPDSILYKLTGTGDGKEAFYIDNKTGNIYVNQPDIVNSRLIFGLTGEASSRNSPKSTQVVVNINVIHAYNTKPPQFGQDEYTLYTIDRIPVGSIIGQVGAIDPDPYHKSTISYMATGNGTEYFVLDPGNGIIQTKKPLVHREFPYILMVNATSTSLTSPSSIQWSKVNVRIIVDEVLPSIEIGFHVPEKNDETRYAYVNRSNYTVLTALGYTTRPGGHLTYNISTPEYNGPGKFLIDPVTGEIRTNGTLQYDSNNPTQRVCINLTDNILPPRSVVRCVYVVFVSDQPPSFDICPEPNSTLEASVLERIDPGAYVTTVKACSLDKPPNNTDMIYDITGGNDPLSCYGGERPFAIDPVSGNITTKVSLMWNCTNVITLNVTVTTRNGTKAVNGSTRQLVITVQPTDASGPTFDSNLPGSCRGIGTDIIDGILDFTTPGTAFIQIFAGDCDAPQYSNHTYAISPSGITFIVPGDSNSAKTVPDAFVVDSVTGDVKTNLPDYRKYSRGYFQMDIVATDSKKRSATAKLTVFIVREGQRIKFTFGKPPNDVRPVVLDFMAAIDRYLNKTTSQVGAYGPELSTHVDTNAYYYFNMTDLCFQVIRRDNFPQVLSANDAIRLFPSEKSNPLYTNYNILGPPEPCYVKTTTHWWSGYWFLWWLLIALALFIFVVALILNILACCFWPMYTRGYLKSRPYIVLDEPPTTSPVSDFEWQESMHRIN